MHAQMGLFPRDMYIAYANSRDEIMLEWKVSNWLNGVNLCVYNLCVH